ncbi:enoyl-CoA hydratase-related protein, partial [Singulisphaera rosea]
MGDVKVGDRPELGVRSEGGVITVTLDRPERRNALSRALVAQLEDVIRAIGEDVEARVVVLEARGKVFCSGHDLGEMLGRSEDEYRELF